MVLLDVLQPFPRVRISPYSSRTSAITPTHVQQLLTELRGSLPNQLSNIYVQPSQRIFPDSQYEAAGATISERMDEADILLGVKVRHVEFVLFFRFVLLRTLNKISPFHNIMLFLACSQRRRSHPRQDLLLF